MKYLPLALLLPFAVACTKKGGRERQPIFLPTPAEAIVGLTAEEENFRSGAAMDLDSGFQPAVAYRRSSATYDAIEVVRRRGGFWNSAALVSDDGDPADVKTEPLVVVTRSDDFVHVFWHETAGSEIGIHYAILDASDPPVVLVPDTLISTTVPANVPGGTNGAVTAGTLVVAVDRTTDTVFAAWAQFVDADGGGPATPDEVVVVGASSGGVFGEHFAVLVPDLGATAADVVGTADPPIVLDVDAGGTAHILWVSTTVTGGSATRALRHRTRTGVGAWSGPVPNGDVVSDTVGENIRFARLLLAGDGDAYVAWAQSTPLPVRRVEAAYRPAGAASVFSPSAVLDADPGAAPDEIVTLRAYLSLSEVPHVFYKRASGGLLAVFHQECSTNPAAGWGASTGEQGVGPVAFAGASAGSLFGHVDENGSAVIVWDAPPVAGSEEFDVFYAVRPAGGSLGNNSVLNLTNSAANSRLDAGFSWWFGPFHITMLEGPSTGAREVLGALYSSEFGLTFLRSHSESPITDSHGDGEPGRIHVIGGDDGVVHVLFREHSGSTTHDLFYDHD